MSPTTVAVALDGPVEIVRVRDRKIVVDVATSD